MWFLWLKLLRLPTVFTALSNVMAGYLISHEVVPADLPGLTEFWLLLLASSGLYLGGMVLNDVCDSGLDAIERPERPIPSGRIARSHALLLAVVLLGTGIAAAAAVGQVSAGVALLLAVLIIAYDAFLKSTAAGCFTMGACRFFNLLLGASAVSSWDQLLQMPQTGFAGGLFLYVVGVTWFARHEASVSARGQLRAGLGLVLGGLVMDALVIWTQPFPDRPRIGALISLSVLALSLMTRTRTAINSGQPRQVQRAIGVFLLNIIFLDAIIVFAVTGNAGLACVIVALVIPASLLKYWIPLS